MPSDQPRNLDRDWNNDVITYPEPAVEIIEESFRKYVIFNAGMERIFTGCRWAEGPVWFGDGGYLLFSDIPNNRILRWSEDTNNVSEYRIPSNNSNGNARDTQGRLITCEHLTRRVTRTEHDGSISVIADSFRNFKLNAPNDVVSHSDGSVWFTDPGYGIMNDYEGDKAELELPTAVYRIHPSTGDVQIMATGLIGPNGLCFSPNFDKLYIADSGSTDPRSIFVYDVTDNGTSLSRGRIFRETGSDSTDGIRCDIDGNLWASSQRGTNSISVYSPEAKLIGRIHLPEMPSNLTFGGMKKNRLFITASQSVYSIYTGTRGASLG
ncbi:MAG: SMP-30/gluconolactonase/LRE family protein [Dehalococcoidia bacterium]